MELSNLCLIGNFISAYGHTPQMCEELYHKFSGLGCGVIKGGRFLNRPLRFADMLWTLVWNRNRYDAALIETFSGNAFYWAAACAKLAGWARRPYIPVLRGGNLPLFSTEHKRSITRYLQGAAVIVSPSPYLKKWAAKFGFECRVIPSGLDLDRYTFTKRTMFGPRLFWFRRFHKIYNPIMAVKLMDTLKEVYPDCALTMAGPDAGELENCKSLARRQGLENRVTFKGLLSKQEINTVAEQHDIFINTTDIDNTPFSLIEAAAMGLPIVSTNVGGIPDLFVDKREAFLVNANDVRAMARAITAVIGNPSGSLEMLIRARKKVEAYAWDLVKEQWLEVFRDAVTRGAQI